MNHEILIAGIAPLFSLFLGIWAYQYSKRMKATPVTLFTLWLGVAGVLTFFGYLMIAPLMPVGDTGKVFKLLDVPMFLQVTLAIVAIILLTLFLVKSSKEFEKYAIEDYGSIRENRKKWSIALILIPLLISIVIVTALQFPIPHIISILATTCTPLAIMAVFGTFIGSKEKMARDINGESLNAKISKSLMLIFVISLLLNRALVYGFTIPD